MDKPNVRQVLVARLILNLRYVSSILPNVLAQRNIKALQLACIKPLGLVVLYYKNVLLNYSGRFKKINLSIAIRLRYDESIFRTENVLVPNQS